MAKEKEKTNVTRIKASDSKPAKPAQKSVKPTASKPAKATTAKAGKKSVKPAVNKASKKPVAVDKTKAHIEGSALKRKNFLVKIKEYFVGAWFELRQVRWPDRRATWGMTGALLVFTGIFVTLILLIDALFKYLFQLIIA